MYATVPRHGFDRSWSCPRLPSNESFEQCLENGKLGGNAIKYLAFLTFFSHLVLDYLGSGSRSGRPNRSLDFSCALFSLEFLIFFYLRTKEITVRIEKIYFYAYAKAFL